jgi:hypothetical protein
VQPDQRQGTSDVIEDQQQNPSRSAPADQQPSSAGDSGGSEDQ